MNKFSTQAIGALFLGVMALCQAAHAQTAPKPIPHATPEPDITFDPQDLNNDQDWKRRFYDVVIVINKAASAQTIEVYLKGQLVKKARTSTGRETPALANPDDPSSPKHDYFTQTYTGYYTPDRLDIDHHSNTWAERGADGEYEGAFMPWAVFFNGGIATHRSPFEDLAKGVVDKRIGRRASGGCVRLHEQDARDVFWWVRTAAGPYDDKKEMNREHAPGEPDFKEEAAYQEKYNQLVPYAEDPQVADVDPSTGAFIAAGGKALLPDHPERGIKWHKGSRTLIIVMNVGKNPAPKPSTGMGMTPNLQPAPLPPASDADTPVITPPVNIKPRAAKRPTSGQAQDPISQFFGTIFNSKH